MNYHHTRIWPVRSEELSEMRALVRAALGSQLAWRHHAIGVLQAYLIENCDPEVRIHIWHPELRRDNLADEGGRIHDHRFILRSTVLAGVVGHDEVDVWQDNEGHWREYTVQHARAGAAPLLSTGRTLSMESRNGVVQAGYAYKFDAGKLHRSRVDDLAVTLVTKIGQTATPARVLFPRNVDPTFGVGGVDGETVRKFVDMAIEAL